MRKQLWNVPESFPHEVKRGQGLANRLWERQRGVFPYLINVILHLDMSAQKRNILKEIAMFSMAQCLSHHFSFSSEP